MPMLDSYDETISVGDHVVFDGGDTPASPWLKHGTVTSVENAAITIETVEHGELSYLKEELLAGPEGFIMVTPSALTEAMV